jgi:putative flippase GtrA
MLKKLWSVKVTRFAAVGVFNTLFDLSMLNVLVFLGHLPTLLANLISASISISVSYFLNHNIVFRSHENHTPSRFAKFFAVTGVGILAIQTLVIYLVTHLLSRQEHLVNDILRDMHITRLSTKAFDLNVAKLCAVAIALVWNFSIYHFVIFKKPYESPDAGMLL